MSAWDEWLSQCRKARKIKSEEPAPGKILSVLTSRACAIDSIKPSHPVGGDVRSSHGKYSCKTARTPGAGGNQASSTSALMIVWLRSKVSNFAPRASKKAPPWKQEAGLRNGKFTCQTVLFSSRSSNPSKCLICSRKAVVVTCSTSKVTAPDWKLIPTGCNPLRRYM